MGNEDALSGQPEPVRGSDPVLRRARPPGPVVAGATVVVSAGLVFAELDWWPGRGRGVDAFTNTVVAVGLGVLLLAVGVVWAVQSLYVLGRARRWSWWILPVPLTVVVAAAAVLLIPSPSFQSSRDEFDLAVQQFLSAQDSTVFDRRVGPYTISRIERGEHGSVFFYDADQAFLTVSGGWAYSPAGSPTIRPGFALVEVEHIDGPWYEFTSVWN